MDTLFNGLRKTLIATVFIMFGLVATYIPQTWNDNSNIETTQAAKATLAMQAIAYIEQGITAVQSTLSAGYNLITSWATNNLWLKDFSLDGIAWAIAKAIVSQMVDSLVNWINSGFQGSPAFVQDLQGFLTNAADEAIGTYLDELGGIGSYLCDPFRLDIQVAIATQYELARVDQFAPTCTLTDIIGNITDFTSGAQGSFSQGGWDNWFTITSKPDVFTPYGAYLAAEAGAQAKITNRKGEELSLLNFGDGFLSGKICETVQGAGTTHQECFISKPGKIIQEALSFNLDSGRQSLIAADEINEILGALLGQIANMAITGATGLLGLGSNNPSGPNYSGFTAASYTPAPGSTVGNASGTVSLLNTAEINNITAMEGSLSVQNSYNSIANYYRGELSSQTYLTYSNNFLVQNNNNNTGILGQTSFENLVTQYLAETNTVINNTNADITTLNNLIAEYRNTNTTSARRTQIFNSYNQLTLYTNADMSSSIVKWESVVINN